MRICTLTLALTLILAPLYAQEASLKIHFIHVGYGDCILIEAPDKNILIDAGYEKSGKKILKYLKKRQLLPVDSAVITHPHDNHYGGLLYLLDKITIKQIYWNKAENTEKEFKKLLVKIAKLQIPMTALTKGDAVTIDEHITLECLHPEQLTGNLNNDSLVLLLTHANTSFLFAGDIGPSVQKELAQSHAEILRSVSVLKLPHHGDTLDETFARTVETVRFPILTIGKNKHKLPAFKTLRMFGERLLRSDYSIDIVLESDGESVRRIPPKKR